LAPANREKFRTTDAQGVDSQRFKNGLHSFETATIHGFWEGNIALNKGVMIESFDQQDRRLALVVATKPGKACFG
jgi:hypothetical protein